MRWLTRRRVKISSTRPWRSWHGAAQTTLRTAAAAPIETPNAAVERQAAAPSEAEALNSEERLAAEQWLRRIPDDPGGLLRRKFLYQYQQRQGLRRAAAVGQGW